MLSYFDGLGVSLSLQQCTCDDLRRMPHLDGASKEALQLQWKFVIRIYHLFYLAKGIEAEQLSRPVFPILNHFVLKI